MLLNSDTKINKKNLIQFRVDGMCVKICNKIIYIHVLVKA